MRRPSSSASLRAYRWRRHLIPGWLSRTDLDLFTVVDDVQRSRRVTGDVLEIGVFHGKTAIPLRWLLADGERLVVCDLFDSVPSVPANLDESGTWYAGLSRDDFERHWRRFHRSPPVVVECDSRELLDHLRPGTFRLIHVDGAHVQEVVEQDVRTALELAVTGAVIVVDDYRTDGLPGVAAAFWPRVEDGSLVPVLFTKSKVWAVRGDDHEAATAIREAVTRSFPTRPVQLRGTAALWVPNQHLLVDRLASRAGGAITVGTRRAGHVLRRPRRP